MALENHISVSVLQDHTNKAANNNCNCVIDALMTSVGPKSNKKISFRRPTRRINPNPLGAASSISLKHHESMVIEPTMFGDALMEHGDYSTGLFYGGRRKFLKEDEEKLRPPSEFMTMKQKRSALLNEKEGDRFKALAKLEFTKKIIPGESDGEQAHDLHRRPIAKNQVSTITIQRFPSVNPSEWDEVKQAGCTFYRHRATGELSPQKPWQVIMNSPAGSQFSFSDSFMDSFGDCDEGLEYIEEGMEEAPPGAEEQQWGCGSLAYNGSEVSELLNYLDGIPWSDEKTPR